jgi:hypothetical protein
MGGALGVAAGSGFKTPGAPPLQAANAVPAASTAPARSGTRNDVLNIIRISKSSVQAKAKLGLLKRIATVQQDT